MTLQSRLHVRCNIRRIETSELLITSYMLKCHIIESTLELVEIVETVKQPRLLALLDVESLFSNVPTYALDTILYVVYNHHYLPPPSFS